MLSSIGYDADCAMIATMIGKDLIVWTPRTEVIWEPWFIIDKRGLFSFVIRSNVDLADVTGRLTVKRVAGCLCLSLVKVYTSRCLLLHSVERRIKSDFYTKPSLVPPKGLFFTANLGIILTIEL